MSERPPSERQLEMHAQEHPDHEFDNGVIIRKNRTPQTYCKTCKAQRGRDRRAQEKRAFEELPSWGIKEGFGVIVTEPLSTKTLVQLTSANAIHGMTLGGLVNTLQNCVEAGVPLDSLVLIPGVQGYKRTRYLRLLTDRPTPEEDDQ